MAKHYSVVSLREIGEQCGNKLPPASAIQAMFLYEMQRETELERLFQGHLFELARADDRSNIQQQQLSQLSKDVKGIRDDFDAQLKAVRKEITSKEVEERISTSQVRMNTFNTKLNQCLERVEEIEVKSGTAEIRVNEIQESVTADREANDSRLASLDGDVALLFEERDAMFDMISKGIERIESLEKAVATLSGTISKTNEALASAKRMIQNHEATFTLAKNVQNDRIEKFERQQSERIHHLEHRQNERVEKLEDLVRALTAQSPVISSPASQVLSIHTTNGQLLDLAVQKGSSFVPYKKENKENIRSFTPGKQWAA